MLDSPLLNTLRLMEQEEIDTLHFFVASPIFQAQYHARSTLRLFEELKKFQPAFDDDSLRKEVIAQQLFGGGTNPDFDITRAMADLMRIVKHFINFRYSAVRTRGFRRNRNTAEDQSDPRKLLNAARQDLALMRFYNERLHNRPTQPAATKKTTPGKKVRQTDRFFENLYVGLIKDLKAVKDFSAFEEQEFSDYLYFCYLAENEKSIFDGLTNPTDSDQNLIAAIEELDAFYLFNKLHLLSRFISHEKSMDMAEARPEAYKRMIENKKLMLRICKLINKMDPL